jgi:hypothetical protein
MLGFKRAQPLLLDGLLGRLLRVLLAGSGKRTSSPTTPTEAILKA